MSQRRGWRECRRRGVCSGGRVRGRWGMRGGWGGRRRGDCAVAVLPTELPPGRKAVAVEVRLQQRVIRGCAEIPEIVLAGPRVEIDIGVVEVHMPATVDAAVSRGMLERVRLAPDCAARFVFFIAIAYPAVSMRLFAL